MAETTFHSITLPGQNPARVPLTAVEFSTSTVYKVRDYCTYQGKLYICSTAHAAGAWNAAHFTEVNVGDEINTRLVVPPTTEPASTDRRVGDLWIDTDTESPVISVDPQPTVGSTNVPQSGGTFNLIKNLDNNKAGKSLLTGNFSTSSPYSVNQLCIHDGYLYRCKVDIPTGTAWDGSKWEATTIETELARIESEEVDLDVIAETFGDSSSYAVGDYVLHTTNGVDKLYRCTSAVSDTSVWNSQYWSEVKLADEVSDLKSALDYISSLGKNLFDKDNVNKISGGNVYIKSDIKVISQNFSANQYCGVYIPIESGKTYTISKTAGTAFQVGTSVNLPEIGVSLTNTKTYNANTAITITAGASDAYLSVIAWKSTDALTEMQMLATLMIEEGSTATEYVPFKITAYDDIARTSIRAIQSDLLSLAFLGDITLLDNNTDLDTLGNGVYYSDTTAKTASLLHCPFSHSNCKIIVFTRYNNFKQQIGLGGNGKMFFRASGGSGFMPWRELGNNIDELSIIPSSGVTPKYGENICPQLSTFSGNGANWDGTKWVFSENGSISTNVNFSANKTYLIEFTVSNPYTSADEFGVPGFITAQLGDDSVTFFAANDAYWYLALKPTTTSTQIFSVTSVNGWTGKIAGITIKEVTEYVSALMTLYNQNVVFTTGNNLSVGGFNKIAIGQSNTSYGKDAQIGLEAARWNTAVGTSAQRYLRNGTGNTAIGASSQANIIAGCYNNAVGNATQQAITNGNWNNAFGNEAQLELTTGCNNVNIGRRSGTAMRTGNYNTHIGTWTGFIGVNTTGVDDNRNTITANFQTLIGGRARQIDHQSDYLTAVGFESQGDDNAVAIGARAKAKGENSIAIGYGVQTAKDDEVAIGASGQTLILAGKKITFNQDGTVTWEALM